MDTARLSETGRILSNVMLTHGEEQSLNSSPMLLLTQRNGSLHCALLPAAIYNIKTKHLHRSSQFASQVSQFSDPFTVISFYLKVKK